MKLSKSIFTLFLTVALTFGMACFANTPVLAAEKSMQFYMGAHGWGHKPAFFWMTFPAYNNLTVEDILASAITVSGGADMDTDRGTHNGYSIDTGQTGPRYTSLRLYLKNFRGPQYLNVTITHPTLGSFTGTRYIPESGAYPQNGIYGKITDANGNYMTETYHLTLTNNQHSCNE